MSRLFDVAYSKIALVFIRPVPKPPMLCEATENAVVLRGAGASGSGTVGLGRWEGSSPSVVERRIAGTTGGGPGLLFELAREAPAVPTAGW